MEKTIESLNVLTGNYIKCYSGHSCDNSLRFQASSGGLVTALLIFALEEKIIDGALLVRMKKDSPLEAEFFLAKTRDEIYSAMGSKYGPVFLTKALKELKVSSGRFAVVGKPCDIRAIRKAEELDDNLKKKIVLHFGLFCNHTPNLNATEHFLKKLKIKDIVSLSYRGKGWPGTMTISQKDKKINIPHLSSWSFVGSDYFISEGCLACSDNLAELADLSFGDAWLTEFQNDKLGTSLVISRTALGEELLQKAKKAIEIKPISVSKIIMSQIASLYLKKKAIKARTKLLRKKIVCGNVLNSNLLDYFISFLLLINLKLPPSKIFWLYNRGVKFLCYRRAKLVFKKYINVE